MRVGDSTTLELDPAALAAALPPPAHVEDESDQVTDREQPGTWSCAVCEVCGQPARIDILDGYANGTPVRHAFCLTCAGTSVRPLREGNSRLRLSTLATLAAFAVLVVGVFGDFLIPAGNAGFGWHQRLGVVIGTLIGLFGLLLRAELVTLAGAFLFGASLTADWFGLTHGPGIGWKQQWMIAAGLTILIGAVLARMRYRLWATFSRRAAGGPAHNSCPAGRLAAE
jgi:hypothetical protein